jgi:glyoxylase-like metal-dependent hydrolase (beta-lactamase superfamily II)
MGHVIYPVLVSKLGLDKSLMTYFANFGTGIKIPVVAWYINAGGKNVLIDTGASKEVIDTYWHGGSDHIQTFEEALGKLGKEPGDIDYIIATHLHFDHIANARLCKNAKVICQETELKFAYSPHALFAAIYPKELFVDLKFQTVNGECEIVPGIRVIPAPGHTPGTQAVGIETDKGLAVITGFCCTNANFEVPDEFKVLWPAFTPGIHCDALAAYDSALKIKGLADILIPQHEEKFAMAEKIPM